jgi:LysR family hydrogen peroxide-inducible transcriptional activator
MKNRPLPTVRQMRHFVALKDHENFSRAAEICLVEQSSLSASIRELENLLGRQVVERTKRRVTFTSLGNELAERFRRILRDTEDSVDLVASSEAPLSGVLRLGVIPTIGPFLLPRLLPQLRKDYPDLRLYLREEQSKGVLIKLRSGDLDAVIMALPYETSGLTARTVANDPFFVVFPRGHEFAEQESIHLKTLQAEPPLLLEDGHCLKDHAMSVCNLKPEGAAAVEATSLNTLVYMVEGGLGITLLPKLAIDAGLLRGIRVDCRPLAGGERGRDIGLIWRSQSARTAEFELLGDLIAAELGTPVSPRKRGGKT